MFEIVSDGSADLGKVRSDELGVHIVPFYVSPDGHGEHKKEMVDLDVREFYQHLVDHPDVFPKTSMPAIQDYLEVFEDIAKRGNDILCLTITSKLSGSYNSAIGAKQILEDDYPNVNIEVIDTTVITGLQGMLVEEVVKMKDMKMSLTETVEKINEIKETGRVFFTVGSMDYLIHGGRVGKLSGLAAGKLGIKPLIVVKEGELFSCGISRGRKKAISKVIDLILDYIEKNDIDIEDYRFGIGAGYDLEERAKVKDMLVERFEDLFPGKTYDVNEFQIGATISVHTGPYPLGIAFIEKI